MFEAAQDIFDEWVLAVCALLPSLTPWAVWESLEWRLFESLIGECKKEATRSG